MIVSGVIFVTNRSMPALDHWRTSPAHKPMSALGQADIGSAKRHVRFYAQKRTSKEVRHESYGRLVPEEPITILILAVAGALDYLPSRL